MSRNRRERRADREKELREKHQRERAVLTPGEILDWAGSREVRTEARILPGAQRLIDRYPEARERMEMLASTVHLAILKTGGGAAFTTWPFPEPSGDECRRSQILQ